MPIVMRLLLIILIIYLIGRLIRLVFPYLLKWWVSHIVKKANPEAYEEMKRQQKQKKSKPGDILITESRGNKKPDDDDHDKGEYVDFEEL